jgi:hypothetical protein
MPWFQTIDELASGAPALRVRRYGVIEVADERLVAIRLRPFPKRVSLAGSHVLGRLRHRRRLGNRCRLYYNQPRGHDSFLVLNYVESTANASLATFRLSLTVLDEVARIKQSDAILAHISNPRISDRLLARWGWAPHCHGRRGRHFIKRFYGRYPAPPPSDWAAHATAT